MLGGQKIWGGTQAGKFKILTQLLPANGQNECEWTVKIGVIPNTQQKNQNRRP
ncbi:hypothetical protein Poly51_38260 [Rubripirellula tenax]|uniref:Uncharacterized protein n=1 Tax=Rubripirellula tenax TaxID=2528015 RepID=A0A5C6EPL0_9BACT|nr:hypothetical protein Poly51_38260 [Rubripirellula tenax]